MLKWLTKVTVLSGFGLPLNVIICRSFAVSVNFRHSIEGKVSRRAEGNRCKKQLGDDSLRTLVPCVDNPELKGETLFQLN